MSDVLLEVETLTAGYGSAPVIREVSLSVSRGEVVALLGANGAGKTTTLRVLSGLRKPMSGTAVFDGLDVARHPPQVLARRGLAHVPEGRGIFFGLTVAEHFRLGPRGERLKIEDVLDYFPALADLRHRRAGLLSGGEQQMLALARALARRPKLLLLDELSLGLAPIIVERLLPIVRQFVDETGAGALLVEQHVHLALEVADRGIVYSNGQVTLEGAAATMIQDRRLLESSYLGDVSSTIVG